MLENQRKRKYGNKNKVLHKSPFKRWFRNGIHSLMLQSFTVC